MSLEKLVYQVVPSTESLTNEATIENSSKDTNFARARRLWWYFAQAAFILIIFVESILIVLLVRKDLDPCTSIHGMNLQRTEPRTIYQHSKYVSSNESEASEAWKSILPGHGVVAISPNYAASKNIPDTFVLPNTNGRLAYVIEAYHAIHCIANLRQHYTALQRNETWDWSQGHDLHCFDALRQYVMCNIDDTLLHTWGKRDAGHNQAKMCHDWDRLREWAEERSAGYFDVEPAMGIRHLENYHEGDGLPIGALS